MSVKTELHKAFCNNVRMQRAKLGITQTEMARRLGVEQPTYCAIETGKGSPTLDLVERVARALEIEPAKLLKSGHRAAAG